MAGKLVHPNVRKTYGFPPEAFDPTRLPDFDVEFLPDEDIKTFSAALAAPDPAHSNDDNLSPLPRSPGLEQNGDIFKLAPLEHGAVPPSAAVVAAEAAQQRSLFITAQNDWAPVNTEVPRSQKKKSKKRKGGGLGQRTKDETREGFVYNLIKWPFFLFVGGWVAFLGCCYLLTRFYISTYEHFVAWTGKRYRLRRNMRATSRYEDWIAAAKELDKYLGVERWKEEDEFAYYDSKTVRKVLGQMKKARLRAEAATKAAEAALAHANAPGTLDQKVREGKHATEALMELVEACVKNNFVGIESSRLYSQTYYGTKNLVQNFVDETEKSVRFLLNTNSIDQEGKRVLFKRLNANYGRTALCLSGGAAFAYYHFGVIKALLEADLLPDVITGTSGGALVSALVATRTNDELNELLVPALATKITACHDSTWVWIKRWWKTGARFDSVDWAKRAGWWTRGSTTFREAFERTGRILNVSCVPADPHSPTILCNYLTSPDCVIWSAVLASAAVPGILNPVVLMMKTRTGELVPYSFGHKWKDGSLRTDIPIKALNLYFNVNFTIVSQVNPHINLFFFNSRGTVGHPVTHRRGRGWRGGYLGSAVEQYIKLDLTKWLKVLRHLELLPRPLGQDWSQLWLQQFSGTITIWPRSVPSDFWYILSDPDMARLARMIHEGQQSCFPKLNFVSNRLKVERAIETGRRQTRLGVRRGSLQSIISEDDLRSLLRSPVTLTEDETTDGDAAVTSDDGDSDFQPMDVLDGATGADQYEEYHKLLSSGDK